jgi:hypothetical protein
MITWKLIVMRNDSKGKMGQSVLFAYSERPNGSRKSRQANQEVAEGMGGEVARHSSNAEVFGRRALHDLLAKPS